eukprot:CAMPEP_0184544010 /NCGR_PEP_ID=MMETSP0199_2-20130426/3344_1 /TAXON_ID=1112570 /ORGANISM="Thraustochytrium sp., Strain LLF1b" /LENGTH=38 /DNA_ID= /DNA_START= /DNA_END= /DNA_ORIENTATION=
MTQKMGLYYAPAQQPDLPSASARLVAPQLGAQRSWGVL